MRGTIHHHLLVIIAVVAIWALVIYVLINRGIIKNPFVAKPQAPKVELKTEYKNPFDKNTQFVNPFDKTKNPFAVAK